MGLRWKDAPGHNRTERMPAIDCSAPKICCVKGCLADAYRGGKLCRKHEVQRILERESAPPERTIENFDNDYGHVYFIQMGEGGQIKIGKARNVQRRLSSLQSGSPIDLILLASCKADCADLEEMAHEGLKDHRLRGEWFDCCDEVLAAAEAASRSAKDLRHYLLLGG